MNVFQDQEKTSVLSLGSAIEPKSVKLELGGSAGESDSSEVVVKIPIKAVDSAKDARPVAAKKAANQTPTSDPHEDAEAAGKILMHFYSVLPIKKIVKN